MNGIREYLNSVGKITRDERDEIIAVVSNHYKKSNFICDGPCFVCNKRRTSYLPLYSMHMKKGDGWIDEFKERYKEHPISYNQNTDEIKMGGVNFDTVRMYVCESCEKSIKTWAKLEKDKYSQLRDDRLQIKKQEQLSADMDMVTGKRSAKLYEKYKAVCRIATKDFCEELKSLPYKEFLLTDYWDIVKKYKLYKAGFKCELDNKNGVLHVHHKTYEHHGYEHENLEDLIVLCKDCHAKFHDK